MKDYHPYYNILFKLIKLLFIIIIIKIKFSDKNISKKQKKNLINNNIIFKDSYKYIPINIQYSFSFKFNIVKIEYNIGIYDENNNLVSPFDMPLYYDINVICHIKIKDSNTTIDSLANIHNNNYYNCIEFFNIKENINFGIKIYKIVENSLYFNIYLFNEEKINYNNLVYKNDIIFDPFFINNIYLSSLEKNKDNKIDKEKNLNKLYLKEPKCLLKRNIINETQWVFQNIYNHYFCFCKSEHCFGVEIPQNCKYRFYTYIIDKYKYLYKKTEYLFIDFIFKTFSPDDTYPVFKSMEKQKLPVHYITEDSNIYNKYCKGKKKCLTIIPVNGIIFKKYGDFLEKYVNLILQLKAVISAKVSHFHYISILFYNIEYITYIAVGHGLCFFKDYLYKDYRIYGRKTNNKILLPPSNKILSIAKKYGWKNKDIIKINFPRWDKYNDYKISNLEYKEKLKKNSIFMMFTWRAIKENKHISIYYVKNITKLLKNNKLNKVLTKNKIILYFTLHRFIIKHHKKFYIDIFKKNKYIKFIKQKEISECLSKTNLAVSDFSSIIFDLIYRRKPIIIYIPDSNDPQIKDLYYKEYYNIIDSMKNGKIYFENLYFNLNEVINKIIYYINNNFKLEPKLEKFYDSFELKKGNNINKFVNYLKNLK